MIMMITFVNPAERRFTIHFPHSTSVLYLVPDIPRLHHALAVAGTLTHGLPLPLLEVCFRVPLPASSRLRHALLHDV